MKTILLPILVIFGTTLAIHSQDIEALGKSLKKEALLKSFKVSGGLNAGAVFYNAVGIENRRQPFTWNVNGNISFSIGQWQLPFSFNYSNQQFSYQRPQPINITGISPKYKWATLHIGHRNMHFSDYTLAGTNFLGVGLELNPDKYTIALMYGQLNRAVSEESLISSNAISIYNRMGYGAKVGYQGDNVHTEWIVFKAKDEANSLGFTPSDSIRNLFAPAENIVIGTKWQTQFFKNIVAEFEGALSAYTRNINMEQSDNNQVAMLNWIPERWFTFRRSTEVYQAFKTSWKYQHKKFTLGVGYDWIDPNYRTMGAYYVTNDLENITLQGSLKLFQGKVNLNGNTGIQRNNLQNTETSQTKRIVSSINLTATLIEKLNVNLSYSNFNSIVQTRPILVELEEQLDTLDRQQLSQSANMSLNYSFGNKQVSRSLGVNVAYQTGSSIKNGKVQNDLQETYTTNVAYRHTINKLKTGFNVGFVLVQNQQPQFDTQTWGPSLGINRAFGKKLTTSLTGMYQQTITTTTQNVMNWRGVLNYKISEKQKLSCNISHISRHGTNTGSTKDFTAMLNYSIQFQK